MNLLSVTEVLVLLVGAWAHVNVLRPQCDSDEVEEAALVAQDYLNSQHTHGYKFALNRIQDVKIIHEPNGDHIYFLEVELLETDCHVLDPTPIANCTVRPQKLTAIEGDCDVVLKNISGALAVTAFKCKTEESTEDICLGCQILLPLNHTTALNFVHASLATFNNMTENITYTVLQVGRLSSQILPGGPIYFAEYVIVEANCTDDPCVPLNDNMAARGICSAIGVNADHTVDCKMFATLMPVVDGNSTVVPVLPPVVHVHADRLSPKHGLRHHKLTALYDPHLSGLLSASEESDEAVPVAPAVSAGAAAAADVPTGATAIPSVAAAVPTADPVQGVDTSSVSVSSSSAEVPVVVMKRDVLVALAPATEMGPSFLVPQCPGRVRFF